MSRPTLEDLMIADDEAPIAKIPATLKDRYLGNQLLPGSSLARRMLWAASPLDLRRDIERNRSLVLLIETTVDWVDLIQEAARNLIRSADFIVRETSPSAKSVALQDIGLRNAISMQRSLVIITTQEQNGISKSVLAVADYHLRVEPPNRTIIAATLRSTFGLRRAPKLPPEIGPIADASALIAAFRPGESAGRAIRRLSALSRNAATPTLELPPGPTLAELHGYGAAKDWGMDLARDIYSYRAGRIEWSSISSAAILHGVPGVGKTFFAGALARTCNIPLITTSFGRLFASTAGYLDSIIKGLNRAFEDARAKAPSILFIDELDALPDRETLTGRGREWWSPICNHFLKLLDDSRNQVIVLAATNMIDRIDAAILRPGRIDRRFEIVLPDQDDLLKMFRLHLDGDISDADLMHAARLAQGSTGAGIELMVKSARAQARRESRPVSVKDLVDQLIPAIEDSVELRRICVHEAGHALAAQLLGRNVCHASVLAREGRGGAVTLESFGRAATRRQLEDRVMISLAGRNAEILLLAEASSGAHADLGLATQILAALHGSLGLGESLFQRAPATDLASLTANPELKRLVEADLQRLDTRCAELLTQHRDTLLAIAEALLERRVLSGDDLVTLISRR